VSSITRQKQAVDAEGAKYLVGPLTNRCAAGCGAWIRPTVSLCGKCHAELRNNNRKEHR
jgi:hypothetical protein